MKLPKELTTVTTLSKTIALIMFISLPFIGFLLGIRYQEMVGLQTKQEEIITLIKPSPTPTPEKLTQIIDTSDWKTYAKYNKYMTFKYPPNWYISEYGEGNLEGSALIIGIYSLPENQCNENTDCQGITFQTSSPADGNNENYNFINNLSIGEKKINEKESSNVETVSYTRQTDVFVDGIKGLSYIVERTGKYTPTLTNYVLIKVNNNYYYISSSDKILLEAFIKTITFSQ